MECIKCGKPVSEGELFCHQCSMNLGLQDKPAEPQSVRYPEAKGRMQTPPPRQPQPAPKPVQKSAPKGKSGGSKAPFAVVCLLLIAALGFIAWQYTGIQLEKNRLRVREDELSSMEWDLAELTDENADLIAQIEAAQQTIAAKELALQEVEQALTGSESTMSQTQYDLANMKLELERAKSELTAMEAELESLQTQLEAAQKRAEDARTWQEKAQFMDKHVVVVEDDGSGYYHTYGCPSFPGRTFFVFSRNAAAKNYKPCPVCSQ